jgi:hypothetical protein
MWRYGNDGTSPSAYQSLHANTSWRRMQYPSLPMPGLMAEYPHHREILAYIESYATANDLLRHITFKAPVRTARSPGVGWEVEVEGEAAERFDALVVASGHYWDPQIPKLPGSFDGAVMHACDYRVPEAFVGQRVVVVGAGQSALDIAAELTNTASEVFLCLRQGHHLIPRRMFGRPSDAFDNPASLVVPFAIYQAVSRLMMRIGGGRLPHADLPEPEHRLWETRWPVLVGPALEQALSTGAFQSRPAISSLAGDRVVFADGGASKIDTILFATGYRINFPFLPDHLGQGQGWEFPLYRRILSPYAGGLAFIGVLEPGPGLFAIVERQVAWLVALFGRSIDLPEAARMWQAIDSGGEARSHRQFEATGPHTLLCNRHAYLKVLARDLRDANRGRRRMPLQNTGPVPDIRSPIEDRT